MPEREEKMQADTDLVIEIFSVTLKSDSDLFDLFLNRLISIENVDEIEVIEEPSETIFENS